MRFRFNKINCGHQRFGRGERGIEILFETADGTRYAVGRICKECAVGAGLEGLSRLAWLYTNQAIAFQPRLGEVRIVFDGIEAIYSDEERRKLGARLESDLQISAKQNQWLNERDGVEFLPSNELVRRVSFTV